jgi:hypothetical protein
MAIAPAPIIKELKTHAQKLGIFDAVLTHEPLSAPAVGGAVTYSMWLTSYLPITSSGTASVSMRLLMSGRLYFSAMSRPSDAIDAKVLAHADALLTAYCGDFTLGGLVRQVDIFGQHGAPLGVQFGYVTQDSKVFRTADLTLPLLINDVYAEVS